MVYLQISLNVAAKDRPAAAAIYSQFKGPFLAQANGAKCKELLIRDEDVQVLHGFDSVENATFSPHPHPQGEEIMVLDGEFADEHGIYPAGTYIKNPPGSMHAPRSAAGCTLFVKLRQLDKQQEMTAMNLAATTSCTLD